MCQSCVNHASFKVDGKCACDDGYTQKSNGSSYYCGVSARRLRSSRKVPKLKLKSTHLLPSCNTDDDCNVTYTMANAKVVFADIKIIRIQRIVVNATMVMVLAL